MKADNITPALELHIASNSPEIMDAVLKALIPEHAGEIIGEPFSIFHATASRHLLRCSIHAYQKTITTLEDLTAHLNSIEPNTLLNDMSKADSEEVKLASFIFASAGENIRLQIFDDVRQLLLHFSSPSLFPKKAIH